MIRLQAANLAGGIIDVTLRSKPNQQEWKIGRGKGKDLELPYHGISPNHAKIVRRHNKYYLVDVGSTYGSWLNGTKLQPGKEYPLAEGRAVSL